MIKSFINKVAQFHDAFGIKRGNVDAELRYKLFKEELDEYIKARKENDIVEISDAVVDMLFIACGTVDLHRWSFEGCGNFSTSADDTIDKRLNSINESLKWLMVDSVLMLSMRHGIYDILPELFDEVFRSTMSKLDKDGNPIINDGVIRPDLPVGKILKSENYFKPDIEGILRKHGKIN